MKGDTNLTEGKIKHEECSCKEKHSEDSACKEKEKSNDEIMDLQAKFDDINDKFLRLAAEYDNYRKRNQKDKLTIYRDSKACTVSEFLPIADSVEIAIKACKDMNSEYQKGLSLIQSQLQTILEKLNVTSFGEVNEVFDPNIHDAIAHIENSDLPENVIEEVFQKGYKIEDKIIRHAMVRVAN